MTQKLERLIDETATELVRQVDDCLLTASKRNRAKAMLTKLVQQLETDKELLPPTQS